MAARKLSAYSQSRTANGYCCAIPEKCADFYRAAWMQTRSSDDNSVCPSVCQTRDL